MGKYIYREKGKDGIYEGQTSLRLPVRPWRVLLRSGPKAATVRLLGST